MRHSRIIFNRCSARTREKSRSARERGRSERVENYFSSRLLSEFPILPFDFSRAPKNSRSGNEMQFRPLRGNASRKISAMIIRGRFAWAEFFRDLSYAVLSKSTILTIREPRMCSSQSFSLPSSTLQRSSGRVRCILRPGLSSGSKITINNSRHISVQNRLYYWKKHVEINNVRTLGCVQMA